MDIRIKTIILLVSLVVGVFGADGILKIQDNVNNENTNVVENQNENLDTESEIESGEVEENEVKSVISVNDESFEEEVLKSEKVVLIDFYATWCSPCQKLAPIVEEFSKENKDIKVVKLDIDEARLTATDYGITSIPTLMVIKNGEIKNQVIGFVNKEYIEQMVEEVKN